MKKVNVPQNSPKPYPPNTEKTLSFFAALREVSMGKKATKLEWNNPNIYICLNDEHLQIKLGDSKFHDLIVSSADMVGDDWIIL